MEDLDNKNNAADSDLRRKRRKMGPNSNTPAGASAMPAYSNAAKMMAKMGYVEGQGLGTTGRGRLVPIETQVRDKGVGLGAVKEKTKQEKEEEKREAAFRGETLEDSEAEEKERRRILREKRSQSGRPKVKYRTAAEIEASAVGLEVPAVFMRIIDATRAETKHLTSTAGLMANHISMVPAETEAMKIERRARIDLEAATGEWNSLAERKKFFEMQEIQLKQELDNENEAAQKMQSLIDTVEELLILNNSSGPSNGTSWEEIITKLENAEEQLEQGVDPSVLQKIAVAALHPLFKGSIADWDPLEDPTGVSSYIDRLRKILEPEPIESEVAIQNEFPPTKAQSESTTPYESMIWLLWLPKVQSTLTNQWNVLDPAPAISLLEVWRPLLPSFIFSTLVNQIIVRRLTEAVSSWKPRVSSRQKSCHSQSLHIWLFPWLPHLDEQHTDPKAVTGLFADVKRKFKFELASWDLAAGILPGISSWGVVISSELKPLLDRHLRRLTAHLSSNLVIDPSDQDLDPLAQVLQWAPFFSPNKMADLLVAEFFPKWHHMLYSWLTGAPNYDEIGKWYLWWKERLHHYIPDINDQPTIAAQWTEGLITMNLALDLFDLGPHAASQLPPPRAGPFPPPRAGLFPPPRASTPAAAARSETAAAVVPESTFEDVVRDWCTEEGLLLIALHEAEAQTGQPLFRIATNTGGKGGVTIYLKGDVLWARVAGTTETSFEPVALDGELAARAQRK